MELKHETLWPIVHARLREYMAVSDWNLELVAQMTESTTATVSGWLGSGEPTGERLIKLWHMLAAAGCNSPELDTLAPPNRLCGQLLTFGLMSLEDLQETIGVQQPQAVLRMLRGNEPMHWYHAYDELRELYGERLNEALRRISRVNPTGPEASASTMNVSALVTGSSLSELSGDHTLLAAVLLGAASPLVRYLDSDDCTPQERSRLRELMGQDGMFDLSTHFNRLCSERARNQGRPAR